MKVRAGFQALSTAAIAMSVSGCTFLNGVTTWFSTSDRLAAEYGYVTVSEPVAYQLKDVESALTSGVQAVTFTQALEEAKAFQSVGVRRFQTQLTATNQTSVNATAALLMALGLPVDPSALTAAPPPLPAATLPTPDANFRTLAPPTTSVSTPFGPRVQTALHNMLLARLSSSQIDLLKQRQKQEAIWVVLSTLTVVPGEKTRYDAAAEVRVHWAFCEPEAKPSTDGGGSKSEKCDGEHGRPNGDEIDVLPLFPTYNSVGELNDAASIRDMAVAMSALLQAGPAQNQSGGQALMADLQRLISATERVTLVGAPVLNDTIAYRISGVRTSRPFEELRPRGKTHIEPLTIPMATIVLVKQTKLKKLNEKREKEEEAAKKDEKPTGPIANVSMSYSSRWRRDRPWWDKLPPGTLFPGFWYDRGTSFAAPPRDTDKDYGAGTMFDWVQQHTICKFDWVGCAPPEFSRGVPPAWNYPAAVVIRPKEPKPPVPLQLFLPSLDGGKSNPIVAPIDQPYAQVLLVCGRGAHAERFFLDNVAVEARRLGDPAEEKAKAIVAPQQGGATSTTTSTTSTSLTPGATAQLSTKSLSPAESYGIAKAEDTSQKKQTDDEKVPILLAGCDAMDEKGEVVRDDTYMVLLTDEVLRNAAKAKGIVPQDCRDDHIDPRFCVPKRLPKELDRTVQLTAVNGAGPSKNSVSVELDFDVFYPAPPVAERVQVERDAQGNAKAAERDRGTLWPDSVFGSPQKGK